LARVSIIGARGMHGAYGGIEKVLGQICPRLAGAGHRVTVYSEAGDERGPSPNLSVVPTAAWSGKYTETLSRTVLSLWRALRSRDDIINLVALGPGSMAWLPRLAGRKVVVSVHGLDWKRNKWPTLARRAIQLAEWLVARCAHEITVVSRELEDHFLDNYGRKVRYIPNGVELGRGRFDADIALLAEMGLTRDGYILFASRLVPEKAAHELIAAFNTIDTTLRLVIAGGARYDDEYVARLKNSDLTGRCVFTGHLGGNSLHALFANAYLYVLPSHIEGMSLSLLEAMGHGCAVLVSDIPANKEVIGDCGFTFPVGSIERLRHALSDLIQRPEKVLAMRSRGQARAAALYSWDAVARNYADMYDTLGSSRGTA
jgi:glycosyltransferase involved in cell wall biosynthesis